MITEDILNKYEMTIGIECHVQLATNTKLFSRSSNDSRDVEPNTNVNAVDFALPGMLPVLNMGAVVLAVKAGKALGSVINLESRFDRKHYFYPDLPKGYQTTQMYHPIIGPGLVKAPIGDGKYVDVRIHHAHMEEDAGKLTHYGDYSLVDLNRAGTPLIEIVSEPDMHSAVEARAYSTELYKLMTYAGVTHGDLYQGNMRFDVNISTALKGAKELGRRAEVKNLNSFRSIEKAAEYEFKRQVELLEKGQPVVQETRGWDDAKQKTFSQRSKEDEQDYRYMPDADIPPIVLTKEQVDEIQSSMPTLPNEYRSSWEALKLDEAVVNTLLMHQSVAELVDVIAKATYVSGEDSQKQLADIGVDEKVYLKLVQRICNWFTSTSDELMDFDKIKDGLVSSDRLLLLSRLVEEDKLSSTGAKEVFLLLFDEGFTGKSPEDIAKEKNLIQISDEGEVAAVVDAVMADPSSQKAIEDIKSGNDKAIGFLVGQIMKKSKGKANPALAQKLIRERL